MAVMPRPRKPYVQREVTRHGKTVWYFRKGDGPRIRLSGAYESPEWLLAYERAMAGKPAPKPSAAKSGTLRWLVDQYLDSGRFSRLASETQEMRKRVLNNVCATGGDLRFGDITPADIMAGKVRREATPYAAMNYVKIMSQLFTFAVDAGYLAENPAAKVKTTSPFSEGHHTWTIAEVEQYRAAHPLGTQARLALELLLFTGLRRADAVKLGRQHVKDGVIRYRATKNGYDLEFRLLPPLAAAITATECGDLAFLCNPKGKPWIKEVFGTWFAEQCVAAGVPGRAHGLRKAGATLAAENGADELSLAAMWGWHDPRQSKTYIRKASRKVMAERAANALSPHPVSDVPAPEIKTGT